MLALVYAFAGIDDIRSAKKLEELAVDFFNCFTRKTVAGGELRPRTGLVITSNCSFGDSQRYHTCHYLPLVMCMRIAFVYSIILYHTLFSSQIHSADCSYSLL